MEALDEKKVCRWALSTLKICAPPDGFPTQGGPPMTGACGGLRCETGAGRRDPCRHPPVDLGKISRLLEKIPSLSAEAFLRDDATLNPCRPAVV